MIKVFGIGNPLLRDDGIGIEVAKQLPSSSRVKVYIGEIFVDDCLENIQEEDYIVIIDAVSLKQEVGNIHFLPFQDCLNFIGSKSFCHDRNLLGTLLLNYPKIRGELIGIEIAELDYGEGISETLSRCFPNIIQEIRRHLEKLSKKEGLDQDA